MPTHYDKDNAPKTIDETMYDRQLEKVRAQNEAIIAKNRAYRRGKHRVKFDESKPGDLTHNTPTLRKWTKIKSRLQNEVSQHTFLLQPRGRCVILDQHGYVDREMTLAVLVHYRYIMASRKDVTHYAE